MLHHFIVGALGAPEENQNTLLAVAAVKCIHKEIQIHVI